MKIKLKNTPKQIELIKALASPNKEVASRAQEAMAAFIGPIVQKVLDLMGTANLIYSDWPFNEDDDPSFPLDLFYATNVDHVQVWQQNAAGGLGSSLVTGLQELKLSTYRLDTAVSLLKKTVRRGRLPYVSLALNRASQEMLRKIERNGWLILLKALGEASTGGSTHTIAATTQNVLQVDDFSRLITKSKRINLAFDGTGTPDEVYSRGATDLFMSPEMVEQIRGFAYQPMNTRQANTAPATSATAVPLPDSIRERIYNAAGQTEIFGKTIHEMLEFGTGKRYNAIFANFAQAGIANAGGNFAAATDEIIFAVDLTREACIRPIAQNADNGATLTFQVDDQFPARADKIGWFGAQEQGNAVLDSRVLSAIVV